MVGTCLWSMVVMAMGEAGPVGGDYGAPRVIVPAPENPRFAHLGWPKITRTFDGTLVLAYIAGRSHGADGCPAVSISTDNGGTFTKPHILMEFDTTKEYRHSGNLAIGVAEDGAVVLLAMAFTGKEKNTIYGWRSTDSGRCWQRTDTSTLDDSKTGSVYGHVFSVPGKGLAVAGHYRMGSRVRSKGIWISYSTDNGRSWGEPVTISESPLVEPAITFAAGRFIGLIRDNSSRYYRQLVSDDMGETWHEERSLVGGGHDLPSPFISSPKERPDTLYALQCERNRATDTPGRIFLWAADAKTLSWQRHGVVVEFPKQARDHTDFGYAWMVQLDTHRWFLVFYSGTHSGPNSIYGMTIQPED